ncbi:MAG: DUF2339 domain-containing protein [Bryobacteraceae bacterium]|jgi:hypothetical protein
MEFLVLVIVLAVLATPVILLVRWRIISQRFTALEGQLALVSANQVRPSELAELRRRVYRLEGIVDGMKVANTAAVQEAPPKAEPVPAPVSAPATEPEPASPPKAEPVPIPVTAPPPPLPVAFAPEPAVQSLEPPQPPAPATPPATVPPPPFAAVPRFAEPEPARPSRSSEEWEAVVGGNWLNKLGIFVLVIAIALFLGYSFTQMGPAGRSAIGLAVSFALLVGGVVLERRAPYVIFARGLLGGGWAGLYFTTYAMQAVDAAKVIHNPLLGGFLLLAVAAGMVAHSLRYRVQALTGLAYFMAFATLAITPVTTLSVIALVPLAGSLLIIAYQFSWSGMVLFGLIATYATCASRGDNGAPLWSAQTVFAAYWLLFEAYDLLRAGRRSNHPAEQAILPLNAIGFAGLSYAKWSAADPAQIYLLASGIAAAYLADTILRAVLRPPATFPAETTTEERIFAGGYEGPITLAALCSVLAAVLKLHGQTANTVLLAEGQALFLAGLIFRQGYPRRLAGTLFAGLGLKLLFTDIPDAGFVNFAGRTLQDWTPTALLAALVFYVNRGLRKSGRSYGFAASALVALAIGFEISLRHLGIAWLGFGALLFIFGWQFRLFDFRMQGYLAGVLALGAVWLHQIEVSAGTAAPWAHPWLPLAVAAAAGYGAALCALRSAADRFTETERQALQAIASAVASAASAALLWRLVPAIYLGPAWMALGILALDLGLRRWPSDLRTHAHVLAALGAARVLYFTVLPFHAIGRADERIAIGCTALLAYAFAARFFAAKPDQAPQRESRGAVNIASTCGSLFALVELWALLNPVVVAPAWALFALLLMEVGLRADLPGVRLQGHLAAAAAFGRLFFANLEPAGYSYGISHRLLNVSVVIASHYFEWWRQGRWMERLREWERLLNRPYLYTAAALMTTLLYLELRPPFIEIGWAFLTVLLLVGGRFRELPDLRFQSYALAAVTFWRALALELYPDGIFASADQRIAAGVLVIGCLFVTQLFLPQTQEKSAPEPGARLLYSLLATSLATAFLYQEVSGSMLTVAWGIEGAALLAAGFPLRDRTLRLSGLALFLVCIGKLFFYDLRELETLYRILSFFVLGVILVGVSWIYTRFRDRIQRYL